MYFSSSNPNYEALMNQVQKYINGRGSVATTTKVPSTWVDPENYLPTSIIDSRKKDFFLESKTSATRVPLSQYDNNFSTTVARVFGNGNVQPDANGNLDPLNGPVDINLFTTNFDAVMSRDSTQFLESRRAVTTPGYETKFHEELKVVGIDELVQNRKDILELFKDTIGGGTSIVAQGRKMVRKHVGNFTNAYNGDVTPFALGFFTDCDISFINQCLKIDHVRIYYVKRNLQTVLNVAARLSGLMAQSTNPVNIGYLKNRGNMRNAVSNSLDSAVQLFGSLHSGLVFLSTFGLVRHEGVVPTNPGAAYFMLRDMSISYPFFFLRNGEEILYSIFNFLKSELVDLQNLNLSAEWLEWYPAFQSTWRDSDGQRTSIYHRVAWMDELADEDGERLTDACKDLIRSLSWSAPHVQDVDATHLSRVVDYWRNNNWRAKRDIYQQLLPQTNRTSATTSLYEKADTIRKWNLALQEANPSLIHGLPSPTLDFRNFVLDDPTLLSEVDHSGHAWLVAEYATTPEAIDPDSDEVVSTLSTELSICQRAYDDFVTSFYKIGLDLFGPTFGSSNPINQKRISLSSAITSYVTDDLARPFMTAAFDLTTANADQNRVQFWSQSVVASIRWIFSTLFSSPGMVGPTDRGLDLTLAGPGSPSVFSAVLFHDPPPERAVLGVKSYHFNVFDYDRPKTRFELMADDDEVEEYVHFDLPMYLQDYTYGMRAGARVNETMTGPHWFYLHLKLSSLVYSARSFVSAKGYYSNLMGPKFGVDSDLQNVSTLTMPYVRDKYMCSPDIPIPWLSGDLLSELRDNANRYEVVTKPSFLTVKDRHSLVEAVRNMSHRDFVLISKDYEYLIPRSFKHIIASTVALHLVNKLYLDYLVALVIDLLANNPDIFELTPEDDAEEFRSTFAFEVLTAPFTSVRTLAIAERLEGIMKSPDGSTIMYRFLDAINEAVGVDPQPSFDDLLADEDLRSLRVMFGTDDINVRTLNDHVVLGKSLLTDAILPLSRDWTRVFFLNPLNIPLDDPSQYSQDNLLFYPLTPVVSFDQNGVPVFTIRDIGEEVIVLNRAVPSRIEDVDPALWSERRRLAVTDLSDFSKSSGTDVSLSISRTLPSLGIPISTATNTDQVLLDITPKQVLRSGDVQHPFSVLPFYYDSGSGVPSLPPTSKFMAPIITYSAFEFAKPSVDPE
jgi:hypothetical protein